MGKLISVNEIYYCSLRQRFSNSEEALLNGCDVMLERAHMTPRNRYTCTIFINNGFIYSEGVRNIFFFHRGH